MEHGPIELESDQYRKARRELADAEIALRDQREHVASLRRALPLETKVPDYEFSETSGNSDVVRATTLSALFRQPTLPLVVYQFMYGGAQTAPCPMCSLWIDGFNGIARHLNATVNFVVIAEADLTDILTWADRRQWKNLRFLSSAGSSFKKDLHFEDTERRQHPGFSVFVRRAEGEVVHSYSVSAYLKEGEYRGIDLYSPLWNILDLTPEGRGDFMPSLEYRSSAAR